MTVPFNNTPSNLRVPLFYAEMDNSAANTATTEQVTLLIGLMLAGGAASKGVPVLVSSNDVAWSQFGRGSMLADMYARYRKDDPFGTVWAVAVDDPAGATAAGSVVIGGAPTEAGTVTLYINGTRVQAAVAAGDSVATVATALAAAINAQPDLPVTATAAAGTVTLAARWAGLTGNDTPLCLNYYGQAGGEALPAGLTCTITAMAGGTGAPDLSAAITAMGDEEYDFIVLPFTDSASLDALKLEMDDSAGRWSWLRQIYGHVYAAARGALATLVTLGAARNDQHTTVVGYELDTQLAPWAFAAQYTARNAVFIKADPARPTQTGVLSGVLPARKGKRFSISERQTLLNNGIATSYVASDTVRVERAITTYQKNSYGVADNSYLDSETLHQLAYIMRALKSAITSKYARCKLADDGTRVGAGAALLTPTLAKAELVAQYRKLEAMGIVENTAAFQKYLVVERNATDPNRLDVLYPPDLVNQLRVFAVLSQFRLQY